MHHRLYRIGGLGARELFLLGFSADNRGNSHCFLIEIVVNIEHFKGFFLSLLGGGVHSVTLLPEELGGAQERTGSFFPSYNAAPLIVELGQVAVCIDDLFIVLAEKCFGCRANGKTLGELFLTADSYPSALGSKALDVVFFLLQKAFGNKHGHVNVLMACFLKASVQVGLNKLPDSVAVGADHHAALYARIVYKLGLFYYVGVPFCEINVAARNCLDHFFVACHISASVGFLLYNISIIQHFYYFSSVFDLRAK